MMEIITVNNLRDDSLRRSCDSWGDISLLDGVIVVDYSGFTEPRDWYWGNVFTMSGKFNPAYARNVGYRLSRSPVLGFINADISFDNGIYDLVKTHSINHDAFIAASCLTPHFSRSDIFGFVIVKRWIFTRLRGYQEHLFDVAHGWGYEQQDFINRLRELSSQLEFKIYGIPDDMIHPENHDDNLRVMNYDIKDPQLSYNMQKKAAEEYIQKHGLAANYNKPFGVING